MEQLDSYFMVTGSRVQTLIEVFRAINVIADEVRIFFNPEGLEYSGMDPSHVLMADLSLPADFFDAYRFSAPVAITINLKDVLKQLRGTGKNDELTASIEEGRLLFRILDYSKGGTKPRAIEKRIMLRDDSEEDTPKPKIFFKSRARIIAESLKETLKDMMLVADEMSIEIDGDILHIGAHDNGFSADSEYEKGADDLIEIRAEEPSLSAFTTEYISHILNAVSKLSEVVEIFIGNKMPIKISTELPKGHLDFYAAPCLNKDGSSMGILGAESVTWDPKPILVYQKGDVPAIEAPAIIELTPIPQVPEATPILASPVVHRVGSSSSRGCEPEAVEPDVEDPEAPAIDDWTLRGARIQYYLDNPGVYETPTSEQLQPYLEGAA